MMGLPSSSPSSSFVLSRVSRLLAPTVPVLARVSIMCEDVPVCECVVCVRVHGCALHACMCVHMYV